jgi:hypothetical protein
MPALIIYPDKKCINCNKLFNRSVTRSGRLEGREDYEVRKFCSFNCYKSYNSGHNHYSYNPNGSVRKDGYVRISINGKRPYLHRHLMEQKLGRPLNKNEHIHHKDGNPENNDINNLELTSNSEHGKIHYKIRGVDKIGQFTKKT